MKKTLHITVGLPGSGKTHWAKEMKMKNRGCNVIHTDELINRFSKLTLHETLSNSVLRYNYTDDLVIDTFVTTSDGILQIIESCKKFPFEKLQLHVWEVDREACRWNDIGRRSENSNASIEAEIEEIDVAALKKKINSEKLHSKKIEEIKIIKHEVVKKPEWKVFYDEYMKPMYLTLEDDCYVKSEGWCLGGSWADCWGNSGSVSGEVQPTGFSAIDQVLEKVCPNISFLQYKNIMNEILETEDYTDGDYYGGTTYHARYMINVERLYQKLKEKGLYKIEE
jgi:hypothetical protein